MSLSILESADGSNSGIRVQVDVEESSIAEKREEVAQVVAGCPRKDETKIKLRKIRFFLCLWCSVFTVTILEIRDGWCVTAPVNPVELGLVLLGWIGLCCHTHSSAGVQQTDTIDSPVAPPEWGESHEGQVCVCDGFAASCALEIPSWGHLWLYGPTS